MTRRDRLLALLWTLNDLLPAPHGSLNPARGLAASERVACPDCSPDTPGMVVARVRGVNQPAVPCLTCGGELAVEGKRAKQGRGWVQTDRYDADHAPVQTSDVSARPTRPPRMVNCDACCDENGKPTGVGGAHLRELDDPTSEYRDPCRYCNGSGKRAVTVFSLQLEQERSDEGTALEAAIDRRREQGSYHELDQALVLLPSRWRRLVVGVHVERLPLILDSEEHLILEAGLKTLEFLMPDTIRVPAQVKAAVKHAASRADRTLANGRGAGKVQLDKRDKEIRKLVRQGRPTQWVAGEYALSVASVNRIVNGEETAA